MYLLNKLENGLGDVAGLPLVTINLGMITRAVSHKNKNKTFPYGQLFSLIFDQFDVDVIGEESKIANIVVNCFTINWIAYCQPTTTTPVSPTDGTDEKEKEEKIHQVEQGVGLSQKPTLPSIRDLLQSILEEVRGMCESMECFEGHVTTTKEELATWLHISRAHLDFFLFSYFYVFLFGIGDGVCRVGFLLLPCGGLFLVVY